MLFFRLLYQMNIPMRPVPDREQGAATHGQHVRVLRQLFLQRRDLVGIQSTERNRVPVIVTQRFILEIIDLSEKHDGEKKQPAEDCQLGNHQNFFQIQ